MSANDRCAGYAGPVDCAGYTGADFVGYSGCAGDAALVTWLRCRRRLCTRRNYLWQGRRATCVVWCGARRLK